MTAETRKRLYSTAALLLLLLLLFVLPQLSLPPSVSTLVHGTAVAGQDLTGAALRHLCRLTPGATRLPSELESSEELASRDELMAEIERLRLELRQAEESREPLAAENRRLAGLLNLSLQTRRYSLCVARPVRREPVSDYYETMLVDKGASDGLREGQAAVTAAGLIGIVSKVEPRRAEIWLLANPRLTFSCQLPSRQITGIVTSSSDFEQEDVDAGLRIVENPDARPMPRLLFPPSSLNVEATSGLNFDIAQKGDRVVTSSLGNPNLLDGILVGQVEKAETDTAGAPRLRLRPAADIRQLTHVLIAIPATAP